MISENKYHIKKGMVQVNFYTKESTHLNLHVNDPKIPNFVRSINFSKKKTLEQAMKDIRNRLIPSATAYFKNAEKRINEHYIQKNRNDVSRDIFRKIGFENYGQQAGCFNMARHKKDFHEVEIMGYASDHSHQISIQNLSDQQIFDLLSTLDGIKYGKI